MENTTGNCNGKIWVFWSSDIDCNIPDEDKQQTCNMKHNELQYQLTSTLVYAKWKYHLRINLWEKMLQKASLNDNPWCTLRDFNVINSMEEKNRGLPYNIRKSMDFIVVIKSYGLLDIVVNGYKFAWSNKRGINQRIWKRLDRSMVKYSWFKKKRQTTITPFSTTGLIIVLFFWKWFPQKLITSST